MDNNAKTVTGPLVYVPIEATAEFTLLQNQFAPEFGHSSGGQFNTIVKSGTNELRGSLYEYFQNRNLNAVDQAFARQDIREIPRFDQNRLGGSVGGPIRKNKLFYFGNFEYAPLGQAFTLSPPVSAPAAEGFARLAAIPGLSQTNHHVLWQPVGAVRVRQRQLAPASQPDCEPGLAVRVHYGEDYTLEVRYLGTRGVHLLVQNQMFRFAPVTAERSLPTYLQAPSQAALDRLPLTLAALQSINGNPILGPYGFTSRITWWPPIGNSFYNGLAVQLNRRFSRGVQLVGSHTWSHNLDDSTATHFSTVLTPRRNLHGGIPGVCHRAERHGLEPERGHRGRPDHHQPGGGRQPGQRCNRAEKQRRGHRGLLGDGSDSPLHPGRQGRGKKGEKGDRGIFPGKISLSPFSPLLQPEVVAEGAQAGDDAGAEGAHLFEREGAVGGGHGEAEGDALAAIRDGRARVLAEELDLFELLAGQREDEPAEVGDQLPVSYHH